MMAGIERITLECWTKMGLVKTKQMAVDTAAQPKHIAYPNDSDTLDKVGMQCPQIYAVPVNCL
ncbi:MAG: hypothetical protein JRG73_07920 [Deltaproteobacteria bacterium]|nr:hypothetical protein [Deltaproteobacteria bacterium]